MILQSLRDLALREHLLELPDFEPKEVAWVITVGDGGEFLGLSNTVAEAEPKGKPRRKKMLIPRQSGRTSGREAEFLVDKSEYVLGVEPNNGRDSEELEKRTGRDVAIGSVYAALERLEDKGFVTSELGEATPERGGRAKRYFHVTARGLKEVRETQRSLVKLTLCAPAWRVAACGNCRRLSPPCRSA